MRLFNLLLLLCTMLIIPTAVSAQLADQSGNPPENTALAVNIMGEQAQHEAATAPPPPLPDYLSKKQVTFTPQEREALQLVRKWQSSAITPHIAQDGGKIIFAYGASVPTLVCAPFRVSDLELQKGETVNDIILGDNARWHTDIVRVGTNITTPHIIFKPLDTSLSTSVIITTNRRAYHINLKSDRDHYMPVAGFIYPNEINTKLASVETKIIQKQDHLRNEEGVDISNLDFGYRIEGKTAWKPVQVFNDSVKTYIKMPNSVSHGEMPVLLVENKAGQALVNYRIRNNTFVVDQLFERAVLIIGVGSDQQKVTIEWEKA